MIGHGGARRSEPRAQGPHGAVLGGVRIPPRDKPLWLRAEHVATTKCCCPVVGTVVLGDLLEQDVRSGARMPLAVEHVHAPPDERCIGRLLAAAGSVTLLLRAAFLGERPPSRVLRCRCRGGLCPLEKGNTGSGGCLGIAAASIPGSSSECRACPRLLPRRGIRYRVRRGDCGRRRRRPAIARPATVRHARPSFM